MAAKITSPILQDATARVGQLAISADLVAEVHRRKTRVAFSSLVSGGFTLNIINTVFVDPHLDNPASFDWLVCILAHEFCHVQQKYWVDSVEQELKCYQVQARVCQEIKLDAAKPLYDRFLPLDPKNANDLDTALQYIIELAGGSVPTQTIYKSLPKSQPTRLIQRIVAAIKELSAAALAGIQSVRLTRARQM
ncbi:MAG: hypothetical protein HY868_04430 [Chloroflexi bacterium]|nr:hypothetical protein [Chloroflexota bacterium]